MKTVRVRIAVAVDSDGDWNACGSRTTTDDGAAQYAADTVGSPYHVRFVEAQVPVPDVATIRGEVKA